MNLKSPTKNKKDRLQWPSTVLHRVSTQWNYLLDPDNRSFKNEPPKPVFKTTIVLDPSLPADAKVIEAVTAAYKTAVEHERNLLPKIDRADMKVAASPLKREKNEDGSEYTGRLLLTAKMDATFTKKVTKPNGEQVTQTTPRTLAVVGRDNKAYRGQEAIGFGSILNVQCALSSFYTPAFGAGLSVRLEAVQVVEPKSSTRTLFTTMEAEEDADTPLVDGDACTSDASAATAAMNI